MSNMLRYALPVIAAVGAASAQSVNPCSTSATLTVQSAGDASALASCTTYTGNIAVATGTTDTLNFASVKALTGSLNISSNAKITVVGADSLRSIGGLFTVNNCQIINSLNFPQLTSVGGIDFEGLPNLNQLGFTANVKEASSLNIQNTFLATLDGINLQSVGNIYIANNRLLQDISFQVSNISQSLTLESNGERLTASFPNLLSAQNLTFRNVPSLSIPSLHNVSGSLGFYENTFTSISAPNLTTVGGTFAINTNTVLTNISFAQLTTVIGGLQVQNNTVLLVVNFPSLQTVGGATDMYGNFTEVDLPALKDNKGAFNIQSSADISKSCNVFGAEQGPNNVIKGAYQCAGDQSAPGNAGTRATGASATSTKKSDAGDVSINVAYFGLTGVIAAMFGLW